MFEKSYSHLPMMTKRLQAFTEKKKSVFLTVLTKKIKTAENTGHHLSLLCVDPCGSGSGFF
jgi:hypothetical protein